MADPRHPDYEPANDPTRPLHLGPLHPGPIERDPTDPAQRIDPYNDPVVARPSRGLAGATIAVAVVLLAVFAFALMGGTSTQEANAPGTVAEDTNPATGSIEPDAAPAPEPAPIQPAQ